MAYITMAYITMQLCGWLAFLYNFLWLLSFIGFLLLHDSNGEAVFDGLGIRVRLGEFLCGALEVCTCLFDIRLQLLVIAV